MATDPKTIPPAAFQKRAGGKNSLSVVVVSSQNPHIFAATVIGSNIFYWSIQKDQAWQNCDVSLLLRRKLFCQCDWFQVVFYLLSFFVCTIFNTMAKHSQYACCIYQVHRSSCVHSIKRSVFYHFNFTDLCNYNTIRSLITHLFDPHHCTLS